MWQARVGAEDEHEVAEGSFDVFSIQMVCFGGFAGGIVSRGICAFGFAYIARI